MLFGMKFLCNAIFRPSNSDESKDGARARSRTGTAIRPRDFKSLASTSFATRANAVFDTDR